MPQIKLSQATIDYREEGTGPPAVLIHGLLVNGKVWEPLLPALAPHFRCIVPDLPLGAHRLPVGGDVDLSPPGLAALIAELIERLDLGEVTLVGNDTGGALCQLVAAEHPHVISRLVLTNCDAFEHFPPPAFKLAMKAIGAVPGAVMLLADMMRLRFARNFGYGPLSAEPIDDQLLREWATPVRRRPIRLDLRRVVRGIAPQHTLRAAERLRTFDRPVLLVWGTRDKFFPLSDAERLAKLFPVARLETIDSARTFVQLDAPERLGELVVEFVHATPAPTYEEA